MISIQLAIPDYLRKAMTPSVEISPTNELEKSCLKGPPLTEATSQAQANTSEKTDNDRSLLTPYQTKQSELHFAFGERVAQHIGDIKQTSAIEAGMLGYVPSWVVRATLPYQEPKDNPPAWTRKSGDFTLVVQPGFENQLIQKIDSKGRVTEAETLVNIGYPYGVYPRLLLAYVATEVVRTRQRELEFGHAFHQFLSESGRNLNSGGIRGTGSLVKQQAKRLFSSTFSVTRGNIETSWMSQGFRIFDEACIDTMVRSNKVDHLWTARFRLSDVFYESLMGVDRVPFDLRILNLLSDSVMTMDIYLWLTHRAISLNRNIEIPWSYLMEQFGSGASTQGKFKQTFMASLRKVERLYTDLQGKYSDSMRGLTLQAGIRPSVPKKLPKPT